MGLVHAFQAEGIVLSRLGHGGLIVGSHDDQLILLQEEFPYAAASQIGADPGDPLQLPSVCGCDQDLCFVIAQGIDKGAVGQNRVALSDPFLPDVGLGVSSAGSRIRDRLPGRFHYLFFFGSRERPCRLVSDKEILPACFQGLVDGLIVRGGGQIICRRRCLSRFPFGVHFRLGRTFKDLCRLFRKSSASCRLGASHTAPLPDANPRKEQDPCRKKGEGGDKAPLPGLFRSPAADLFHIRDLFFCGHLLHEGHVRVVFILLPDQAPLFLQHLPDRLRRQRGWHLGCVSLFFYFSDHIFVLHRLFPFPARLLSFRTRSSFGAVPGPCAPWTGPLPDSS